MSSLLVFNIVEFIKTEIQSVMLVLSTPLSSSPTLPPPPSLY
jgi:hypothetical protein